MTHVVIAGAGIAGLSAALALGRIGCRVTLCERRSRFEDIGAGLQLSPNATRHLREWGILRALEQSATKPEAIRIRRARDGTDLATLPLDAATLARFDAPFLVAHRADLQQGLLAAIEPVAGIELRLGTAVQACRASDDAIAIDLACDATAGSMTADGFIDAGGFRTAAGPAARQGGSRASSKQAWRALVPAAALSDDDLQPRSNLWLGRRAHLVHYPLRRGTLVNVVAIVDRRERLGADDPWSRPGHAADLMPFFLGWHRDARTLLQAAPSWHVWPLFDDADPSPWSQSRQTRIGDAAHPMLPFLAQGASQAIEDAAALANAVASEPDDIAAAFRRFEAARRGRAMRVRHASRRQGEIYHLGGPAALARDTVMRLLGGRGMLERMAWIYGN